MRLSRYQKLVMASLGTRPAEVVFKNGTVLNVFTGEWLREDVAVQDGVIVGLGDYRGEREIDLEGRFLVPGFIDGHVHIESSMLTPANFAKMVVPHGTTAVICDPHEIANVLGTAGIDFMLQQSDNLPLRVYFMMPSCVPATPFETSGETVTAADMAPYLRHRRVLGLAEVMDTVSVIGASPEMHQKINLFRQRMIDGHAPGLSNKRLQAYRLAGVMSDHECGDEADVLHKLRAGMYLHIREGSAARNLETIVTAMLRSKLDFGRCMFCTDDKNIDDIFADGQISYNIRRSIQLGMPVADAYRCATLNTARCYGLQDLGAIGPGYRADLVVLSDIVSVEVEAVYSGGKLVSQRGGDVEIEQRGDATALATTIHIPKLTPRELAIPAAADEPMPVVQLVPWQIVTRRVDCPVPSENGYFVPDGEFQKLAVIERHHKLGRIGLGAVRGFNLRGGALGTTVAHDSHNLVLVGDNDRDMIVAAEALQKVGGGQVAVKDGRVLDLLELPIAGLMSPLPPREMAARQRDMIGAARALGAGEENEAFMTLSFLALPVIPEIRVTDRGLFDVAQFEFIR